MTSRTPQKLNKFPLGQGNFFSAITNWEKMIGLIPGGQGSLSHDTNTAFELILSSEGSEGSPRPRANFFHYIYI